MAEVISSHAWCGFKALSALTSKETRQIQLPLLSIEGIQNVVFPNCLASEPLGLHHLRMSTKTKARENLNMTLSGLWR